MLKPEHEFLMPQLLALYGRTMAAFSRTVGLHLSRFRVLFVLHVLGESAPGVLLNWVGMDAAMLTRVLKDFEADGLVVRRTDPADARSRLAALTPGGAAYAAELVAARDRFVADALAGFGADELATLATLMERLEASMSRLSGQPAIGLAMNIDPSRRSG